MEQTEEEEDISNGSYSIDTQVSIPKTKENVGTIYVIRTNRLQQNNIPIVLAPKQTNMKV